MGEITETLSVGVVTGSNGFVSRDAGAGVEMVVLGERAAVVAAGLTSGAGEIVLFTGEIASMDAFVFIEAIGGMGAYAGDGAGDFVAGVMGAEMDGDGEVIGLGATVFSPNNFFQKGMGLGVDAFTVVLGGDEFGAAGTIVESGGLAGEGKGVFENDGVGETVRAGDEGGTDVGVGTGARTGAGVEVGMGADFTGNGGAAGVVLLAEDGQRGAGLGESVVGGMEMVGAAADVVFVVFF